MSTSTLDRRQAVKALLQDRAELLIITGLGSPSYDAFAAGDHDGNFYLWGAMGGAAMVGLGLALAQPKRPVLVLTGDGEQLMGTGNLLTVAISKPGNLTIAVLDNGYYGETGMQRSHSGLGVRLDQIAKAAGFADTAEITDLKGVESYRPKLQNLNGPKFVRIAIAPNNPERALPARDGTYLKTRFRAHLGLPVN